MSCQRSYLRKTLKYSQSRDLDGIQWILWIYTDAAAAPWRHGLTEAGNEVSRSQWESECRDGEPNVKAGCLLRWISSTAFCSCTLRTARYRQLANSFFSRWRMATWNRRSIASSTTAWYVSVHVAHVLENTNYSNHVQLGLDNVTATPCSDFHAFLRRLSSPSLAACATCCH